MDQYDVKKSTMNIDIDQLCRLIDENTFGLKINSSSSKLSSYQLKSFNSTRLKRLNSSSSIIPKFNVDEHDNCSSLVNRFRSLSTTNIIQSQSNSTINNREENNACNMEELTAYFDDLLYLPKSLSSAAELMYT